jgi:hypothetical protein
MKTYIAAIAGALLATPASAQQAMPLAPAKPQFTREQIRTLGIMPPKEYDKPFAGVTLEARVPDVPALRKACNNSTAVVACSYPNFKPNVCLTIIISDEVHT